MVIGHDAAPVDEKLSRLVTLLQKRRRSFAYQGGVNPDVLPPPDVECFLAEQVIVGMHPECLRSILALEASTGIGSLRCVFNGNAMLGNEATLAAMALVGREVLPGL